MSGKRAYDIPKVADEFDDEGALPGRFYAALVGLSGDKEDAQALRRKAMGKLQSISSRLRAIGNVSAGKTGYHASVHYIVVLLYRANADHRIKAREIQRGLGYTAGGVTRRLDSMVRDGLLVREPDPDDGRAWLARLTPDGVALARHLLTEADERSKRLEGAFSVEEWRAMFELLSRLDAMLD